LQKNEESLESERVIGILGVLLAFLLSTALAVFVIVVADGVRLWIRAGIVVLACFFGWLLFFAPSKVRTLFIRWIPWSFFSSI
jgi:hypothetical protein